MSGLRQYLLDKRVDVGTFQKVRPEEYARWESDWSVLGKAAFDQRKKFLLNPLRLEFPLSGEDSGEKGEE